MGISLKTSIISGIIVTIFMVGANSILMKLQINLINTIIGQLFQKLEYSIDEQGEYRKVEMQERFGTTLQIFNEIAGTALYNFDRDGLKSSFQSFAKLREIEAIEVSDSKGDSFLCVYKTPEIVVNKKLPDNIPVNKKYKLQAESYYDKNKVGTVMFYFTDAHFVQQLRQSKEKAAFEISVFRNDIEKRIFEVIVIQIAVIISVIIILVSSVIVCLKWVAIKPIINIMDGLAGGIDQFTTASEQIADSSQTLSIGTNQQASMIQETSASLQQIASVTNKNAENTNSANRLMKRADQIILNAGSDVKELSQSMSEISESGENIAGIVNVIGNIAFQTNILSLNAAVEAARSGEAGAGFSVVAQEVKNLSARTAEAAKNTTVLIMTIIDKINKGLQLSDRNSKAFNETSSVAQALKQVIDDISAASHEQAHGIAQINKALSETDKVVQQNAARAQQGASTAQEMTAQAEIMKQLIDDLASLIGKERKNQ